MYGYVYDTELCAICGESIYDDDTHWYERPDGTSAVICGCCCDNLDAAESGDEDDRAAAVRYFRSHISSFTEEGAAARLAAILPEIYE